MGALPVAIVAGCASKEYTMHNEQEREQWQAWISTTSSHFLLYTKREEEEEVEGATGEAGGRIKV